nr:MAG TPA: hypothetical protein [Caudoviricetes sp.]
MQQPPLLQIGDFVKHIGAGLHATQQLHMNFLSGGHAVSGGREKDIIPNIYNRVANGV